MSTHKLQYATVFTYHFLRESQWAMGGRHHSTHTMTIARRTLVPTDVHMRTPSTQAWNAQKIDKTSVHFWMWRSTNIHVSVHAHRVSLHWIIGKMTIYAIHMENRTGHGVPSVAASPKHHPVPIPATSITISEAMLYTYPSILAGCTLHR